nr:GATA transcription factor 4-like [Ipomoea batatas]
MAIENSDGDAKSIGLCIPPDSLDDLDFFPNFSDDFISITDLLFSTPEKETVQDESQNEKRKRCYKPPRSETGEGRRRRYSNPNGCGWKKRKCSHCETEDTPQWRMGPMGPNTLCNACGVRYKSGRLVPHVDDKQMASTDPADVATATRILNHRRRPLAPLQTSSTVRRHPQLPLSTPPVQPKPPPCRNVAAALTPEPRAATGSHRCSSHASTATTSSDAANPTRTIAIATSVSILRRKNDGEMRRTVATIFKHHHHPPAKKPQTRQNGDEDSSRSTMATFSSGGRTKKKHC